MHNIYFKWDWRDKIIFNAYTFIFKYITAKCKVVCISQVVAKHVHEKLRVSEDRIKVLYNGIPSSSASLSKTEARHRLSLDKDKFVILFVGRLEKQKAVHVLLNAVALLHKRESLQVEIIGSGSLRKDLEAMTKTLNLESTVNFRGNISDVETWFLAADIFVLPSVFEGLGIVILEAFRARLPVIASSLEGPAELIEHGKNGLLFTPGSEVDLASKVDQLRADLDFGSRMAEEAFQRFENRFSIDNYARELERLYKS